MKRRDFLKASGIAGGLCCLPIIGCLSGSSKKQSYKRPNIIVLVTDDQRWDMMGCAGHPILQTPHLDALAHDGIRFEHAFVTTPICMSSRASIFTGTYLSRHQCDFNIGNLSHALWQQSYPILLRNAGYHTGFVGKFGLAVSDKPEPRNVYNMTWHDMDNLPVSDFDRWYGFAGQGSYWDMEHGGKHLTEVMTDQATDFLDTAPADRPFCLSISFKAPHSPWESDPEFDELYRSIDIPHPLTADKKYFDPLPDFIKQSWAHVGYYHLECAPEVYQKTIKTYYRLINGVDKAVGRIRQHLVQRGLAENTVVLLIGDNGYMWGEHLLGGKTLLYDPSIRVPLIVYDPRSPKAQKKTVSSELALNIDIAPTILSLAGIPVPQITQGHDLTPLINGQATQLREDFLAESAFNLGSFGQPQNWISQYYPVCQSVRTRRYKYIRYPDNNYEQFFDLQNDPNETINLAYDPAYQKLFNPLRNRCDQLVRQAT